MRHAQQPRRTARIAAICALGGLIGCTKEPPLYIASELPRPPAECTQAPTPEPKLDPTRDATALDAVKDRNRLKAAFRTERALRKSCGEQLKVLLPQPDA